MARDPVFTEQDVEVMNAARSLETGGMAAFTAHFFSPINEEPRWDLVWRSPDSLDKGVMSPTWDERVNPDEWDLELGQFVPWVPLKWQLMVAHEERPDGTIIGGFGSSKTIGLAAASCYWCMMIPQFKFMDLAPVGWQAKQMFDAIADELIDWNNRFERPRYITRFITKIVERPYPKITWINGSTQEFMSADEQGQKILSWSGDAAVIDEADKLQEVASTELDQLIVNVGSRLRGQIGGRERMGKLLVMANSGYDPELWARFDLAEVDPTNYFSYRLRMRDNPYLTERQRGAIERRIPDLRLREQLLNAERPLPRGKEFTPELLNKAQDEELDNVMEQAIGKQIEGYLLETMRACGPILWVTPYNEHDQYVLIGDPGQNMPPNRNSAVIICLKVTNFPKVPAELAAFWWGPTRPNDVGSYWPFIYKFEEWYRVYQPVYAGYDATGVQKGFNELVFLQRGLIVEGINMQGQKMRMVVALKLIMGKCLMRLPRDLTSIWAQLASWRMPDTKLRQDIASCLFMAADVMHRLFLAVPEEEETDEIDHYGPHRPKRRPRADRRRRRSPNRPNRA